MQRELELRSTDSAAFRRASGRWESFIGFGGVRRPQSGGVRGAGPGVGTGRPMWFAPAGRRHDDGVRAGRGVVAACGGEDDGAGPSALLSIGLLVRNPRQHLTYLLHPDRPDELVEPAIVVVDDVFSHLDRLPAAAGQKRAADPPVTGVERNVEVAVVNEVADRRLGDGRRSSVVDFGTAPASRRRRPPPCCGATTWSPWRRRWAGRLVPQSGPRGTVAALTTPGAPHGPRALDPDARYPQWQQSPSQHSPDRCPICAAPCDLSARSGRRAGALPDVACDRCAGPVGPDPRDAQPNAAHAPNSSPCRVTTRPSSTSTRQSSEPRWPS